MFAHALSRQRADFFQYILNVAAAESAADEGNGAVGAAIVAAVRNADVGRPRRGGQHAVALKDVAAGRAVAGTLAAERLFQRLGQLLVLAHAKEQIHLGDFLAQRLFIALHQAARGHQQFAFAGFLVFRQRQDGINALLLGRVDETAGVHDQDVRLLLVCGNAVTGVFQYAEHQLGIHGVFAAAKGNDAYRQHSTPPVKT